MQKMDVEIPFMSGYLNVPIQSGFSLKKKSTQRYCLLFKASRHGIERLEICESKEDKNPKIITLENCVKITQETSTNLIQIVKKTGTLTLNALTEEDLKEWLTALQTVAFRDKNAVSGRNSTIEEDNDLYCSSYGDGLFIVKLIPSATSIRCNFEPKNYMLHLTTTDIQLKSVDDLNVVIAKWPYKFIRKYGYSDGKFTFEAGRKCKTGEGIFTFYHSNSIEVFRCMSSKTKSMKKLLSGDSLNNLDCGDHQLTAALSMNAGSRSPIPPNQCTTDFDLNTSLTQSFSPAVGFISSNDSIANVSLSSTSVSPSIKHTNKPSRKILGEKLSLPGSQKSILPQSCDNHKKFETYEPVTITGDFIKTNSTIILKAQPSIENNRDPLPSTSITINRYENKKLDREYESIENITDAWKTLGLSDVKHVEHITTPEDELMDFVWQRVQYQRENGKKGEENINNNETSCDTDQLIDSKATYDHLNFLSPKNKTSSGYKTIVNVTSACSKKTTLNPSNLSSIDDYELITNPDIQPCRVADDSYLGYGVLRKPSLPGPQVSTLAKDISTGMLMTNNEILNHRTDKSYAVVSKPKRV